MGNRMEIVAQPSESSIQQRLKASKLIVCFAMPLLLAVAPARSDKQTVIPIAVTVRTAPASPDKPCTGEPAVDRHSALCAQWVSSNASSETVTIGWTTVALSVVAVIVGIGTLIAAIMAALYAKHAAAETKRSAEAAIDAVALAREANAKSTETVDRQLRAYLYPGAVTIRMSDGGLSVKTPIDIILKNTGSTPAKLIQYKMLSRFRSAKTTFTASLIGSSWKNIREVKTNIQRLVGPGHELYLSFKSEIEKVHFESTYANRLPIGQEASTVIEIVFGWVYQDYLGRQWTEFAEFTSDAIEWTGEKHTIVMRQSKAEGALG